MHDVASIGGGFDTSLPGTPESYWATLNPPAWTPKGGPLVVVAPHPDDETLGAGGLIHTWAALHGLPVVIVSVTDGEAACPEVPSLAAIRRFELEAARSELAATGIDIVRLQIPDGTVNQHRKRLAQALGRITPDRATLVAPFERDGHPDHDVVGEVARQVAEARDLVLAQYPIWAWHQATPVVFSGCEIGRFALSPTAQAAKQRAIRRFRSQLRDRSGGPIVPPHVLEYFARPYEMFVL
jgi:LmbE family N-acetylglucosaminyl deacetylase